MGNKRSNRIWYIIYPENPKKNSWDLLIAFVLIITCSVSPMQISFYEDENFGVWSNIEIFFDVLFGIDIIVNFLSAYYDEDFILNDSLKIIALNYVRTWLTIDLVAIFPFNAF